MKRSGMLCLFCGLLLASGAWAAVPTYIQVLPLANPSPGENYGVAGISNAGNVFGRFGGENRESGAQWLASTGYVAESVGQGPFSNGIQPVDVNGAGISSGRAISAGWDTFQYNVDTQEWFNLGGNEGHGSNSFGKAVDDTGTVLLQDGSEAGKTWGNPWDINDFDVVVGWINSPREAALWKPSAVDAHDWGSVVILPPAPGGSSDGRAYNISDSDPGFAAGISKDGDEVWHGMVWNTETETTAADFGDDTLVNFINSAGTMVAGSAGGSARLWVRSADDWSTWDVLDPNTLLGSIGGGGDWASLDDIDGVNDAGQAVGGGTLIGGEPSSFLIQLPGLGCSPGDADSDGDVDDDDLSLLLANWGSETATCAQGEFSDDSPVNDDDLSLLLANWTGPGSGPVPEPATLAVLALGALALRRRRT